jgi:hypothetical protein
MATRNWLGNALAIPEIYTITVGGTWVANETASMTINGKSVILTIGTTVTTAEVATQLSNAWNGSTLGTGYSVNSFGSAIGEFTEARATVSGSVVTITGNTAGNKFTMSVSETSTSGTLTLNNAQDATGPNDWANTANWSGGSVPVDSDDIVIDRPVAITDGLDQSSVQPASLTISGRFSGSTTRIGLPFRNSNGYEEYRETRLKIGPTVITCASQSPLIKIDCGSDQTALTVSSSASSGESGRSAFQFLGTHASNTVTVLGGDVGIAANSGEVATVATLIQAGGTVTCGSGATLTTVRKQAGTLSIASATTTLVSDAGNTTVSAGAHASITANGGTVAYSGTGTLTALTANNSALINFDGTTAGVTVTGATMNDSSSFVDTSDRVTFTNPIAWRGRLGVQPS